MKKTYVFFLLLVMVIGLGITHSNLSNNRDADLTINQLGAAAIYAGTRSESKADQAVGEAAGGIAIGTGLSVGAAGAKLVGAGVVTGVTPIGWACIAAGCIL